MKSVKTVDEYILNSKYGKEILFVLRDILKKTDLAETLKWGSPVYTFNGKNIVGIAAFKSYVGLWFFQGALLKDKANVLINAQEDLTKALRQWRFDSVDEIDEKLIIEYINEATENQRKGKEIKAERNKPVKIPGELENALDENQQLKAAFYSLKTGLQREFTDYVSEAKREETRINRVNKIIPMIMAKTGLNDKYRQ